MRSDEIYKLHIEGADELRLQKECNMISAVLYHVRGAGMTSSMSYHPTCIDFKHEYLVDYSDTIQDCLDHLDAMNNYQIFLRFMTSASCTNADMEHFSRQYKVRYHKISELSVAAAQKIIDDNMSLFAKLCMKRVEKWQIQQINMMCPN